MKTNPTTDDSHLSEVAHIILVLSLRAAVLLFLLDFIMSCLLSANTPQGSNRCVFTFY